MDPTERSRRRILHLSAAGVTTSLAGCASAWQDAKDAGAENSDEDEPTGDNWNPTETTTATSSGKPDQPPAYFDSPDYGEFSYWYLAERTEPPTGPKAEYTSPGHFDSTLFQINVEGDTARVTIENANVVRDIDVTLTIRDVNYELQTVDGQLTATDADQFETRTLEFDISGIDLPTGAGSICELTGTDTDSRDDRTVIIKRHQFVGIEYKDGINWINDDELNVRRWREGNRQKWDKPRGVTGNTEYTGLNKRAEPAGHVEYIDTDTERVMFFVTRSPDSEELFGVSCHIDHEPAQKYKTGTSRYQYRYGVKYEGEFATQISHLQEIAQVTHETITKLGITDPRRKLEYLGDFVQMIPYIPQGDDPPPTVVLYDGVGDCSSKAIMMGALLQNDPWNLMPGFIDCEISGTGHWTIGLDVNDLGDTSIDSMFTIAPSDHQIENEGYTDTEYAFFDLTYDSHIGEKTQNVTGSNYYDDADFSHSADRASDTPPDY
ncbi:hypothetical protein [Halobaculum marinum]|uniref:Transglutaminase-like superfamily protein n=1 Tax=Halobaculum marinum TaxID=3031996 RepID=A0ABD5WV60_9EURY|nr:hypothetical protein [Halobaculum sp. DT55]